VARQARMMLVSVLVALATAMSSPAAFAQSAAAEQSVPQNRGATEVVPSANAVTLVYMNRPITRLRAKVLANMPVDRAQAAVDTLDQLVNDGTAGPVATAKWPARSCCAWAIVT
jgi:hypothetical protein